MFFGLTAIECFVVIIAIYTVLFWIIPKKHVWFVFSVVVILLAVLAFNMEPNPTDDLTRYYEHLDYLRERGYDGLLYLIETNNNNWQTYRVCAYYFYFISLFPDNHYMSAVTIFIVYGLMFLVFYKASRKFGVAKWCLYLGTMFFLATYWYYDTASGVRNGLAFAVIIACAYYHLVEKKNIFLCILGYAAACFTHSAGIMLVALVILALLTCNVKGNAINVLLVFGLAGGSALIQFLATITDNSFIQSVAGKAEVNAAAESLDSGTMFYVNLATYVFVAAVIAYVSWYINRSELYGDIKKFYKFSLIIMFFMLGTLYSGLVFVRFARWIVPAIGSLLFMTGMQFQSKSIRKMPASYAYDGPFGETLRLKTRSIFVLAFFGYASVHLWYLCTGSSLNWMHF